MIQNFARRIGDFLRSPARIPLRVFFWTACLIGAVLSLTLYWPGKCGVDASVQYLQVLSGTYGDWHPPIFCAMWSFLRSTYHTLTGAETDGYRLLFLLQTVVVWGGLLVVLRAGVRSCRRIPSRFAMLVGLFLFLWFLFRDFLPLTKNCSKDVYMLGSWLFAVGILLSWPRSRTGRAIASLTVLCCLFFGTALRHNSIFALLPLLFWLVWHWLPGRRRFAVIVGLGLVLWVAMLGGIRFYNYDYLNTVRLYALQERFYADFFLLNSRTDHYALPPNVFGNDLSTLDEQLFHEKVRRDTAYVDAMFWEINRDLPVDLVFTKNRILILSPEDYARRDSDWILYKSVFDGVSVKLRVVNEADIREKYGNDYRVLRQAWFHRVLSQPVDYLKMKTIIFYRFCRDTGLHFMNLNALVCLALNVLILSVFTLSKKRFRAGVFPALMLSWSAFFYIAPLWLFLTAEVSRYLYWFFASSLIAFIYLGVNSTLIRTVVRLVQRHWEKEIFP